VIVLNYHAIVEGAPHDRWTLPRDLLEDHLAVWKHALVTPAAFAAACARGARGPEPGVLLTLDDACLTDRTLVLAEYMARGDVPGFASFVPAGLVGEPGRMDAAMVRELADHGVAIGSHGMDHVDLTALDGAALVRELVDSRRRLQDLTGTPVDWFAFPFGLFSRRVWRAALGAGYTTLFTTQLGDHRGFEPFLVPRLCVRNDMDAEAIRRHLADPDHRRGLPWRLSKATGLYRPLMHLRHGPWRSAAARLGGR
jgi:peptidoglycan/xylan/chitin deacetylase (PgdA/CDA1 family)